MSSGKVCVHCEEDCSTRPRIKDSHGNYYCKTCHEAAANRNGQARKKDKSPVEEVIPLAPTLSDDDGSGVDIIHNGRSGHGLGLSPDDSDPGFDSFVPDATPQPHVVKAGASTAQADDDDLKIMDTSTTSTAVDEDDDDLQLDMSDSFAAI